MAYALCLASSLAQCRGQAAEAASRCEAASIPSIEHAFAYWHAWASIVGGWASVALSDREAGLAMLKDGLERYAATGAAEAARAAIAEAERTGITFYLAEAYRLCGEALCRLRPTRTAGLRMLIRAVRLAERQGACALQLRGSVDPRAEPSRAATHDRFRASHDDAETNAAVVRYF